ncbi:phage tail sheath family protein [Desulfobulbus propionicus]
MGMMKTPGVYVVEKSAFPNSVVEVATAVPVFIGYTEKADNKGKSLFNKPWRITSMSEYQNYFGFAPVPTFTISEKGEQSAEESTFTQANKEYVLTQESGKYFLYASMMLFFQNGGGPCYVVSVGDFTQDIAPDKLTSGIEQLIKEQEPTMVVIPDAMLLSSNDCIAVQQAALAHCGGKMKNRIALLDIYNGFKDRKDPDGDVIEEFRNAIGINHLDYAAAYYPWLNTTIVQDKDLTFENFANKDLLQSVLKTELGMDETPPVIDPADPPAVKAQKGKLIKQAELIASIASNWTDLSPAEAESQKALLNKSLAAVSPLFNTLILELKQKLNLLPPCGAIAGIITMVDNSKGVWRAPANVSLSSVISPAVTISHDEQEDLNVTTQGKSINAIRSFIGEGTLVWGARTLDGNSLDWRYINVRRTMIMLEESIRLATKAYVFEGNVATTWVTIKSMISNFLAGIWKRGGLAGSSPDDAFAVFVGLNETMTPEDILEGIMRVTVLVALVRPAEFIEITFQQQMQKS